jgi:hypothetical protein
MNGNFVQSNQSNRECSENCVNQNLLNWLVYKTVFLSDEKVKNKQSVLFYGGD